MTAAVDNIGRRKFDLAKYKGAPETDPDDPYGYSNGTGVRNNSFVHSFNKKERTTNAIRSCL